MPVTATTRNSVNKTAIKRYFRFTSNLLDYVGMDKIRRPYYYYYYYYLSSNS